ncbi:MAG: DUF192 domain-containing protein [Gallionellaceae bacterium]|nr:DUF192 domain-containing protein [Gallionellaceae bacterium]
MKFILLLVLALPLPCAGAETITLHSGTHRIQAEIAATPQSRKNGLMRRSHLCADCGMLFIFPNTSKVSFWMKDTPLPLSIAFITADGTILNIEEMQPNTTDAHSAQGQALYALEMPSAWFVKHGIKPGASIQGLQQAPAGQ